MKFRKLAFVLAAALMLGLVAPGLEAQATDGLTEITLSGYCDYGEVYEMVDLINEERRANGLEELTYDPELAGYARQRAAEVYLYYSHTRPDGTEGVSILDGALSSYGGGTRGENIALGQTNAAEVMEDWMNSPDDRANILSADYKGVGIGMFYQEDGSIAWVQLFYERIPYNYPSDREDHVGDVFATISALPENLAGYVAHQSFSNAYCAAYLYEGTTVGTDFYLVNKQAPYNNRIVPTTCRYSYTTSDPSVFTVKNGSYTMTAVSPGVAQIGVQIGGVDIAVLDDAGYLNSTAAVEVLETPELTYEMGTDGTISVDYSEFNSSVTLYYKGNGDELWTIVNREADGVFEHHSPDPYETYIYVMRCFDQYLDAYVRVGEYLVVQLGEEEAVIPEEPPVSSKPDSEFVPWIPNPGDLPYWETEPSREEVLTILEELQTIYPESTLWPRDTQYTTAAGEYEIDGETQSRSIARQAYAMAVSDLIFGDLPVRVLYDRAVEDLRPGDVIAFEGIWHVVTDAAPEYVFTTCVMRNADGAEAVCWDVLCPSEIVDCSVVITRYESESPGVEAVHPGIVPADAVIVAEGTSNEIYYGSGSFSCPYALEWTLTEDGTMYLYGYGSVRYGSDTWKEHKNEIKRLVIGPNVYELDNRFEGYPVLEEVVLGEDVAAIGQCAFRNCTELRRVIFSDGLVEIGEEAFACTALEELELPEGLKSIGKEAFEWCKSLTCVTVPSTVTGLPYGVFSSCKALEEIELPESLTELGMYAFSETESLKSIVLPGSLETLPSYLFSYSGLETAYISTGVKTIASYAFEDCTLKEIHLPNTLTTIEDCVFKGCKNVTDVYFYGTEEEWNAIDISTVQNECLGMGWYWPPVTIHFVGHEMCFHENTERVPGSEPTCTEPGMTEGVVCSDCGEVIAEQEVIPAGGHSWDDGVVTTEPTEENEGVCTYTCTVCGEIRTESVDRLEHVCVWTAEEIRATCTEWGGTLYTCEGCGAWYRENHTPPTGHELGDWYVAKEASCLTDGEERRDCTGCDHCETRTVDAYCPSARFADVPVNAWYHSYVDFVVERGLMNGTGSDTFAPTTVINRASVAVLLWNMAGKPEHSVTENPFNDVKENFWYTDAIFWAYENGVVSGNGAGGFNPNNDVTREQLAVMLYKFAEHMGYDLTAVKDVELASFPDGDTVSGWAATYVKWAVDLGLINGKAQGGQNYLAPKDTATRAEIAVIFTNFTGLVENN